MRQRGKGPIIKRTSNMSKIGAEKIEQEECKVNEEKDQITN